MAFDNAELVRIGIRAPIPAALSYSRRWKSESPERLRRPSTWRPSERVEDRHGVEVVAPPGDLAIGDSEYRDVPVGVRGPGRNDSAFGGVLEHHDAGLDVVMDREVVTSV